MDDSPQPTLAAGRYVLRPFEFTDLDLVRQGSRDPFVPLITTLPAHGTEAELLAYIRQQHERRTSKMGYSFVIADGQTNEGVGQIGLWLTNARHGRASIGYWIERRHRRQGIAAAALEAIASWALTLEGIFRVELYVEPWNEGSWRTAEKCGFQREGLLRSWEPVGAERKDMFMYSRLREPDVST